MVSNINNEDCRIIHSFIEEFSIERGYGYENIITQFLNYYKGKMEKNEVGEINLDISKIEIALLKDKIEWQKKNLY